MTSTSNTIRKWTTGLACGLLLGVASIANASAAPTSYTLMCRGGGGMDSGVISQNGAITLKVVFTRSPNAGSVQPPAPGTCTWVDRRISAGEPNRFHLRGNGSLSLRCSSAGCRVSMAPQGIWSLIKAIKQGRVFQVRAYNERNGWFKVTRIGP